MHIGYGVVSVCMRPWINLFLMRFQVNKKGYFLTPILLFLILATVGEILRLYIRMYGFKLLFYLGSGTGE
jgi:hypothetical protein